MQGMYSTPAEDGLIPSGDHGLVKRKGGRWECDENETHTHTRARTMESAAHTTLMQRLACAVHSG